MDIVRVFNYEDNKIRFVDGKPVAIDVARVLGYADASTTIARKVDTEYKQNAKLSVIRYGENVERIEEIIVLTEPGIYQLIFSSKLESAKKFQSWVFEEVLPSLRKDGSYTIETKTPAQILLMYAEQLVKVETEQELIKQQLALEASRTDTLEEIVHQHDNELERIFHPDGNFYTIRGYANHIGMKVLSLSEAKLLGRKASKLSRDLGMPIDTLPDPRYGDVGCYSEHVLAQVFA